MYGSIVVPAVTLEFMAWRSLGEKYRDGLDWNDRNKGVSNVQCDRWLGPDRTGKWMCGMVKIDAFHRMERLGSCQEAGEELGPVCRQLFSKIIRVLIIEC